MRRCDRLTFSNRHSLAGCKAGEFTCDNGKCVNSTQHCDGDVDCQDGSDEEGCGVTTHHPSMYIIDCINAHLLRDQVFHFGLNLVNALINVDVEG